MSLFENYVNIFRLQVAVDPDKPLMQPQKQSRSANTNSYVVP